MYRSKGRLVDVVDVDVRRNNTVHCPRWSRAHVKCPAKYGRDDVTNLGPGHMNATRKPRSEPSCRV